MNIEQTAKGAASFASLCNALAKIAASASEALTDLNKEVKR